MKNLLVLFVLVVFVTSCEVTYSDEFVIQNDSDYDVRIEAYDCIGYGLLNEPLKRNEDFKKEAMDIDKGKNFKVLHATRGFHGFDSWSPFKEEVDSIVIVFNNERILIQSCSTSVSLDGCTIERNMADYENEYTREKRNRKEYRYTYTITNEDYDRAVAITTN